VVLVAVIGALWSVNKMEIESILRDVCANVLQDPRAAKPVQLARAEGLKCLGRIFRATAKQAAARHAAILQQHMAAAAAAATAAAAAAPAPAPAPAPPAAAGAAASDAG
jgi:hypothetical protein